MMYNNTNQRQGGDFMNDIISLLLTIVGCLIFIQLLPALLWLFVIIMAAAFLYTTYQRYKYKQYQKQAQQQGQYQEYNDHTTASTNGSVKADVIDVEYTESEEEIS